MTRYSYLQFVLHRSKRGKGPLLHIWQEGSSEGSLCRLGGVNTTGFFPLPSQVGFGRYQLSSKRLGMLRRQCRKPGLHLSSLWATIPQMWF